MHETTEAALPRSSVSRRTTSSRSVEDAPSSSPMITSIESHVSRTPAPSARRPWTSSWKSPSSIRAVCSARASERPIQYSSWAIRASTGSRTLLLLLDLLLGRPAAVAQQVRQRRWRPRLARVEPGLGRWRGLLEHPRVLRPAALGGVDDHRALAQRHAREPAGDDVDVVAEHRERPQVDVPRLQPAVLHRGRAGRELHELLGDPARGLRLDQPPLALDLVLARGRPDEDALAAGLARRLDHELGEP